MKLSELVYDLKSLLEKWGDGEVFMDDGFMRRPPQIITYDNILICEPNIEVFNGNMLLSEMISEIDKYITQGNDCQIYTKDVFLPFISFEIDYELVPGSRTEYDYKLFARI